MAPLQQGIDELERAFGLCTFTVEGHRRHSSDLKRPATHASQILPSTGNETPEQDSAPVSPITHDDDGDSFNVSITPPPGHPELHRHHSGLPPTPPTMANSDISESRPDRMVSPMPLFADRVRNALERQKSGISTPVIGDHSPPTPGSSPPTTLPRLIVPRPQLSHRPSSQSHSESFQTATEGHSVHSSSSKATLNQEGGRQEQQGLLNTPRATLVWGNDLRNGAETADLSGQSDIGEARVKTYQMESDTDGGEVRVKNYQIESDSDASHGTLSDRRKTADDSPTSPTLRKALDRRAAYQRLRKPIQPGDLVKRPDEALIYGSVGLKKLPNGLAKPQPRREMDTEFLRNAKVISTGTSAKVEEVAKPASPDSAPKDVPTSSPEMLATQEEPAELREFAPLGSPPDPTPPTTAQKESLEGNNQVYQLIQDENVKRYSAPGDGSVQAVVVPAPENKRKLRHTSKRESLRGAASIDVDSKRSSSESGHKLKHKRISIDSREKSPEAPGSGPLKFPSRVSCFSPGDDEVDHSSAVPTFQSPKRRTVGPRDVISATPATVATEPTPSRTRTLRRSLRQHEINRLSLNDIIDGRPRTADGSMTATASASPRLRRTSPQSRLVNNGDVRRTSLGWEHLEQLEDVQRTLNWNPQTPSQLIDAKLDLAAEDLTREAREVREIRDATSSREYRALSDKSLHTATSPRRKSFDPRYLQPVETPFSISQFSDRTEAEVLVARGVELFPHNNESLLLIQQASQGGRIDVPAPPVQNVAQNPQSPTFEAYVEEPKDSGDEMGKPKYAVDSPLTNPRAAPEPPVIKFIPPTPSEELERSLDESHSVSNDPRPGMQRRPSLAERVRRYSESLIQPLPFGRSGSVRRQSQKRVTTLPDARPTYLSSFWQPRDFWEQYDSDDDSDEYEPLPPGGDTSDVVEKRRGFLPRNMSVRMPGFRGNGGFLVGNSLGLDRHGTNVRRHYVPKRTSEELVRRLAESKRKRTFTVPFSRGRRVEYVGFAGLGARLRAAKKKRQEKALEKRREKLRGSIGTRLYHDGRCGVA